MKKEIRKMLITILIVVGSVALILLTGYLLYRNISKLSSNDIANFDFEHNVYREKYIIIEPINPLY